jgi:hypothetical protein
MDKQERLTHIVHLLQDLSLSSMEIKARFPGVTPRTIERDLEQLAQEGRIHQVRRNRSRNPIWETGERAPTIEVRWMNGRTAAAIKLVEGCLACILPSHVLQDLAPLFERADAALKQTHNREYASWIRKIHIWPAVKEKNSGNPAIARLGIIQEALLQNKTLQLAWAHPLPSSHGQRVHPQGLVFSREGVHLYATTDEQQGLSNQLCNFLISERGQRHALFPEHHLEALQCRLPVVNLLPVA